MSEAHHQEMRAEEPPRAAVLVGSLPWGELRAGPASSPGGQFFLDSSWRTWLLNIIVWIRAAKSVGTYFPERQEFE